MKPKGVPPVCTGNVRQIAGEVIGTREIVIEEFQSLLVPLSKAELSETDYSSELLRGFASIKLFALYREVGQLRAKFADPVGKPDSKCKNGVELTLPVTEGLIYSWGFSDWLGANALAADQLSEILGMKQGEIANGLKFDKGVTAVRKAYGPSRCGSLPM